MCGPSARRQFEASSRSRRARPLLPSVSLTAATKSGNKAHREHVVCSMTSAPTAPSRVSRPQRGLLDDPLRESQVDLVFREANDLHYLTRGRLARDNANAFFGHVESFSDDRFHR
jgi:hypothetical protein